MPSGVEEKTQPSPAFWRRVWADGQVLFPVFLTIGIVNLSGMQSPPTPGFIPSLDKLAHFCVFGLLATMIFRLIPPGSRNGRSALMVILAVSLFGLSDEFHQAYTPGRAVEFADWVADTLGAVVAVFAYWKWDAYRRILETGRRAKTELTGRR